MLPDLYVNTICHAIVMWLRFVLFHGILCLMCCYVDIEAVPTFCSI